MGGPLTFDLCIVTAVQERFGSWGLCVSVKLSTERAVGTDVTLFWGILTILCINKTKQKKSIIHNTLCNVASNLYISQKTTNIAVWVGVLDCFSFGFEFKKIKQLSWIFPWAPNQIYFPGQTFEMQLKAIERLKNLEVDLVKCLHRTWLYI